jgi:hypothetical protein
LAALLVVGWLSTSGCDRVVDVGDNDTGPVADAAPDVPDAPDAPDGETDAGSGCAVGSAECGSAKREASCSTVR